MVAKWQTQLNNPCKYLSQLITLATLGAALHLVQIRKRGVSGQIGEILQLQFFSVILLFVPKESFTIGSAKFASAKK